MKLDSARMNSRSSRWIELGIAAIIILGVALARWPWHIKLLNNFDAINYALAVDDFDVRFHRTQPPGYYLYIVGVRAVSLFTGDVVSALAVFSTLASGLGVYFTYLAGRQLFGKRTGLIAAILLGISTTFWYQGEIAAPYTGDLALSALVAWLSLRARKGSTGSIYLAAFFLGAAGAYRPQSMAFLAPLMLFALWGKPWKNWAAAGGIAALSAVILFYPGIQDSGGLKAYLTEVFQLASTTTAEHKAAYGSLRFVGNLLTTLLITFKAVGEALWIFVLAGVWIVRRQKPETLFLFLWFIPTWAVFFLLYPGNPGTILVCIPPFFLWAARAFDAWLTQPKWRWLAGALLGGVVSWQLAAFLILPDDFLGYRLLDNANNLARNEARIQAYLDLVSGFSPAESIVFADNYRLMQYYLPDFFTCSIPRMRTGQQAASLRFCTHNGETFKDYGIPINELISAEIRQVVFLDIPPASLPASASWMKPVEHISTLGDEVIIWVIDIPTGQQTSWTPEGLVLEP